MKRLVTICLLTLGIQCVSSAGNGLCPQPVCCYFIGTITWDVYYKFNLTELQNELSRCEIISYGKYYFNLNNSSGMYMFNEVKETLRLIVNSGKKVYLRITFVNKEEWYDFLRSNFDDELINLQLDTLTKFLEDFKITGIILDEINLYPSVDAQIIALTNKMKNKMKKLRVGLKVEGLDYKLYNNLTVFNLTATNVVLDNYFVDMTLSNKCNPEVHSESLNPIESINNLVTLEKQCNGFNSSAIDKCKSYVILKVPVTESHFDATVKNEASIFQSYSKICSDFNEGIDVKSWCLDSLFLLYYQAAFVQNYFSGLMLSMVEGDDFNCKCGCTKYPVTNSLISGWFGDTSQFKKCDKIEEIRKTNMH